MVGRTIGKYRIVEALGRGGMGTVYKAVDETLDREVAVKMLNADLLDTDGVKRFRAEAVTLARLSHPHIAHVYELTRDGDSLLMVMEYLQGETFEKLVARGAMPVDRAVALVAQVLDALQHAHRAGVVHRDLKPANLMLTPSGDVKVMDFGIARVQGAEHLTSNGYMMGTPAYMAPEQVRGDDVDARTDVYAMGVVLYQMVTGQLPFKASTAVAMIQKQLNDAPTPSRQLRADIPDWLDHVLQRSLAKAPSARFQSVDEFRLALLQSANPDQYLPTLAPMPTPAFAAVPQVSPSGAFAQPPVTATASPPMAHQTTVTLQRSHLTGAAVVLAVLVVAVGALAFMMLRGEPEAPAATQAQVAATPGPATTEPATPPPAAAAPATVTPAPAVPATTPAPTPAPAPAAAPTRKAPLPGKAAPVNPRPRVPATAPAEPPVVAPEPAPVLEAAVRPVPEAPVVPASPPLSFRDVKLVVTDGDKVKEHDVQFKLEDGLVSAISTRTPSVSKSMPFRAVVSATYSQSKHPRWKEGIGVAVVAGVFSAPLFFMKSTKHWLTLQSKDDYFVLHLDKDNVRSIIPAIESRTGVTVQRLVGDK